MTEQSYNPDAVPLPDLRPDPDRPDPDRTDPLGEAQPRPDPGKRRDPADTERQSVSPAGEPPEARVEESR